MVCSQCRGSGFVAPLGFMAKACPKCKSPQPLFLNTLNLLDEHKIVKPQKTMTPKNHIRSAISARIAHKRLAEQRVRVD